jgi:hypothetical protein
MKLEIRVKKEGERDGRIMTERWRPKFQIKKPGLWPKSQTKSCLVSGFLKLKKKRSFSLSRRHALKNPRNQTRFNPFFYKICAFISTV